MATLGATFTCASRIKKGRALTGSPFVETQIVSDDLSADC